MSMYMWLRCIFVSKRELASLFWPVGRGLMGQSMWACLQLFVLGLLSFEHESVSVEHLCPKL